MVNKEKLEGEVMSRVKVGVGLESYRIDNRLSVQDVCKELGISYRTYKKVVGVDISAGIMKKIVNFLSKKQDKI